MEAINKKPQIDLDIKKKAFFVRMETDSLTIAQRLE